MPLRINKDFSPGDNKQESEAAMKLLKKMAKQGHFQKVRKPTKLEVYNDAARILEELLEARIDSAVKGPHKPRRNKTDPNSERVLVVNDNDETKPVARSKTMPSKYRESKDEPLKQKELDELQKRALMARTLVVGGSESSLDTDDDKCSEVSSQRKKKNLFKRTKERLIQTFRRDKKNKDKREEAEVKNEPTPKKKPPKKKKEPVLSESKRHLKAHMNEDRSIDYTEEVEYRYKSGTIHKEMHSGKDRSNSFSSIFKHLRSSTRKEKGQNGTVGDGKEAKSTRRSTMDSVSSRRQNQHDSSRSITPPPPLGSSVHPGAPPSTRPSGPPPPPAPPLFIGTGPPPPPSATVGDRRGLKDLPLETVYGPLAPKSISPASSSGDSASPRGAEGSSSSSTQFPASNHSGASGQGTGQVGSNVLDTPGDDIEYMDLDDPSLAAAASKSDGARHSGLSVSSVKYHGSDGLLRLQWLADCTAENAKRMDFELTEETVHIRHEDGHIETKKKIRAELTASDVEEDDEFDFVDGPTEDLEEDKDNVYQKCAQKLIEMADSYHSTAPSDESSKLNELEKNIIALLQAKGDKLNKKLDDKANEEVYDKFKRTVQQSIGNDMSWDLMTLLFYTTRGVVNTVGRGTSIASQAKELTLQYISDKYASWIMEQGGFDSMLSESESDYDVD